MSVEYCGALLAMIADSTVQSPLEGHFSTMLFCSLTPPTIVMTILMSLILKVKKGLQYFFSKLTDVKCIGKG